MNSKLQDFKESLRLGMIENFKRDGSLAPILFFFKDGTPMIGRIPDELLSNSQGKVVLAGIIRNICQEPTVLCAGIIMEANGAKISPDTEMTKLVLEGNLKVSELKDKTDLIVMMFSTPEGEEMYAYTVDVENKTVGDLFSEEVMKGFSGTFSHFFTWNQN